MDDPVAALKQGLASLFKSKELSDFTVTCGPHTFKVHKAILWTQSAYFGALPNFAEGAKNSIEFKAIGSGDGDDEACDDPDAITLMVHFFYHLDYRADVVFIAPVPLGTRTYAHKVIKAHRKSKVPSLKSLAVAKFIGAVDANWRHDSLAEAAHLVYTTTPEDVHELRDVVASTLTEHGELLDNEEVEGVVRSITGLAYELLKRSLVAGFEWIGVL
ncbi:hypothetical protein LTR08_005082 [Meristemomyces frigidus]|nr:hypothetical protein LTR08_005082 [Meristemomyces frigidus]